MTNKLFPPITYSIQNGEPIIEGYTMQEPDYLFELEKVYVSQNSFKHWQQSKVDVKVDKELNDFIVVKIPTKSFMQIVINKPINIDFLADGIEVREERILLAKSGGYKDFGEIIPPTIIEGKPYKVTYKAFLLPEKKEEEKERGIVITNVDAPKSYSKGTKPKVTWYVTKDELLEEIKKMQKKIDELYSIEQIEKAIDTYFNTLTGVNEIVKKAIVNNLTK